MIDKNFSYFLHGASIKDYSEIEEVFTKGIKNFFSYTLSNILKPLDNNELMLKGLENCSRDFMDANPDFNAIFLIIIPKSYLVESTYKEDSSNPPMPLIKPFEAYDENLFSFFTPKLVYAAYLKNKPFPIFNPNFNLAFDPSGHLFSDEQIDNLRRLGLSREASLYRARRDFDFNTLYDCDKKYSTWDDDIQHYESLFNPTLKEEEFSLDNPDLIKFKQK